MLLVVLLTIYNFNPRSREGSDDLEDENGDNTAKFQSTLP